MLCLELITRELPARGTEGWLDSCTPESLVEVLWDVGFLRAETQKDTRPRHVAAAWFLGPHQATHQAVVAAQRLQIHPMFWSYLGSQASAA